MKYRIRILVDAEDDLVEIYNVDKRSVFVYAIFDGRRDLSEILYQRLIR